MVESVEAEIAEQEPPAQTDPTGRWTRSKDILGRGAFKTVYKGFDETEGIEVAWNQIQLNELVSTKEDRERLFAEIRVLKQLKHKNIMTFFDSWLENKGYTVNFITEFFTSGTLRQYRKRHKHMDPEVMKRWAWQILCGLVYLHGHTPPIIHRDLKCDNVFINGSDGVVKIGDLGLATMLRARTAPQSVLGTPEFMAPELYDEEYDDRVDVYSFGMCLLELATLEYPYSECRNAAQIYRKVTLGVRPKALSRVTSKDLVEFISHCILPRDERPRSRQLLKHPYFDSVRTERCNVKLSAEALGLPIPSADGASPELLECTMSAGGSSTVSRASSATGELQQDSSLVLDAVPEGTEEEEEENKGSSRRSVASAGQASEGKGGRASVLTDVEEGSQREFMVKGRLQEDEDKLSLRLRIQQPDRAAKVVEFDFDLTSDTAMSVASEMVEEMSLSHSDAHRIALAIKKEILVLTHKLQEAGDSDEESRSKKPLTGDNMTEDAATTTATSEVMADSDLGRACSDSVMSVHDIHRDPSSPHPMALTAPASTTPTDTLMLSSPPDSHLSFGGSPLAAEPMLVDLPPPKSSPTLSAPAWRSDVGPASFLGVSRATSDSALLQPLGRTDSANQASELEALQKALGQHGDDSSKRLAFFPPKEEDRRLPLKKLLQNLHEGFGSSSPMTTSVTSPSRVNVTFHVPCADLAPKAGGPRPGSTPPEGDLLSARQPELRRMSYDAVSPSSSTSGRQAVMNHASRVSSPKQEVNGSMCLGSQTELPLAGLGPRCKSKADLAEAKELRRRAAQTSLRNMESKSLEGLDTFGISRGCKQVPIKSLLGWGKS